MMVDRLIELGYDGADIHWLHKFFRVPGAVVYNPNTKEAAKAQVETQKDWAKFKDLVNGGAKFYIDQAIDFGRMGLDYTQVEFKVKSDE